MKSNYFIGITILIVLILTGCGNSDSQESYSPENVCEQIAGDYDFGDTNYNIEYDSQNYFDSLSSFTAVSDGYYFIHIKEDFTKRLAYIDRESMQCFLVCSNPDCKHDSESCNAYISEDLTNTCYYDGHLYFVLTEWESETSTMTISLYRMNSDGSVREKIFDMYTVKSDGIIAVFTPQFIIHRGYVYYSIIQSEGSQLYRKKLNANDKAELLYSIDMVNASIGYMQGYGDGIFFAAAFLKEDTYEAEILYYSQRDEQIFRVIDDADGGFTVFNDYIIYNYNNTIYKFSLKNLCAEVFLNNCRGYISSDSEYIYVDNIYSIRKEDERDFTNRDIKIYNISGELTDSIDLAGNEYSSEFGDNEYLFQMFSDGEMYAFNKAQIGTAKHDWIKVNLNDE